MVQAVKATKLGYDGVELREPGEVFGMPDGVTGSWFEPVEAAEPEAEKPAKGSKPKAKPDESLA